MTRAQAIAAAAECIAEAELAIHRGTVEEAARRAYTPTGPSIEVLEQRIREVRTEAARPRTRKSA